MKQLTLKEYIAILEKLEDKDRILNLGLGFPNSYRGIYKDLAFELTPFISIKEMLEEARDCIGKIFGGYKGGEFCMDENSLLWIAEYGCTGEPLTELKLKEYEIYYE